MYTKILVVEDLNSISEGIKVLLEELNIPEIVQVQYCDDALLKLKKGVLDKQPFQLLITDLSFKKDHRNQQYTGGEDLIAIARKEFKSLDIIVYSIEDRLQRIKKLTKVYGINGYICKGRSGIKELKEGILTTAKGKAYFSPVIAQALKRKDDLNIDDFDIKLLQYLAQGFIQEEISSQLRNNNITPNSLSTIEKRINKMKILLKAQNAVQLIAVSKDMGLI